MTFADQRELFPLVRAPGCLRAEIASCLAPCAAGCTRDDYAAQVRQLRDALQSYLGQRNIRFWTSDANFVLLHLGDSRLDFIQAMRKRGILVRDRNSDPGCAGCVRITIGTRPQMQQLFAALDQLLPAPEVIAR